jgi:hypothetical protein
MPEPIDTVIVFTARSPGRIIDEGGSQAWKLNPARVKSCKWLVCTQNRQHKDHNFSDATEPHGTAFMIAKISSVTDRTDAPPDGRWKVTISEYARIDVQNAWSGDRNPVRYASLKSLGINPDALDFQPMSSTGAKRHEANGNAVASLDGLTISEAKRMLAVTFGVKPDAIEITIRA